MVTNVNVRNFRQKPMSLTSGRQLKPGVKIALPAESLKYLVGAIVLAVFMGSIMSYGLHGRILSARERVQQLRAENSVVATKNVHLLAARAQLTSKMQVVALAEKKLKLFEPEKGQVHRM